jgi:hypothetical protein
VDCQVLALQTGQDDLFLENLDSRYDAWRRYQRESFARTSLWYASHPTARVRVEQATIDGEWAEALVQLTGTERATAWWRFRRVDGQWRQVPPIANTGRPASHIVAGSVSLICDEADAPLVRRALARLGDFAGGLWCRCGQSGSSPPTISLRILPYISSPWSGAIPSPRLGLEILTPDEQVDAVCREMRLAIAQALLSQATGEYPPATGERWLLDALACRWANYWQGEWKATVRQAVINGSHERLIGGRQADERRSSLSWELHAEDQVPFWDEPLAYTLGAYLESTYTSERLRELIGAVGQRGAAGAVQSVLGLSTADLTDAWTAFLQENYGAE